MSHERDKRVYLDYNAAAPLRPEARAAMVEALDAVGNPSSIHAEGRRARALVEGARRSVAALAGVQPRAVTFVSGGTEALNAALTPDIAAPGVAGPMRRLILSAGEHVAAFAGHRFAREAVEFAPLTRDGRVDLDRLDDLLVYAKPALVALHAANNETGVLQPVAAAAARVHAAGGLLISDAAQLAGRLPFDAATLGADAILLSAHKFGGPKGAGALIVACENLAVAPLVRGGGQERGQRGGTENVAAIAGFGAAARAAAADVASEAARLGALRDRLEALIFTVAPDAVVFGAAAPRLPNTVGFAVPGLAAAMLLMRLDLGGVAASSGAACSSGKVAPSHVLAAMGVKPALAEGAIRLSLGWATREDDIELFGEVFRDAVAALRRRRA